MAGFFYEDLKVGDRLATRSRTVTGTDIDLFATMTGAVNPLFLNDQFAADRGFKGRVSPGVLNLGLAVGLQYGLGLFDEIIALLGIDKVKFPTPLYEGDMVRVEVEVLEKKETSNLERGVVTLKAKGLNQRDEVFLEAQETLIYRRKK